MVVQQGLDHAIDPLGRDQGEQRVDGTEGVPQREGAVVVAAAGLQDLATWAAHAAVGVGNLTGVDEHMVERGVEDSLLGGWGVRDADAAQVLVPDRFGPLAHSVKTCGAVRRHIGPGAGHVHGGQGHAGLQHTAALQVER